MGAPDKGTARTHIFMEDDAPVERMTRFVWDTEKNQIHTVDVQFEHRWHEGGHHTENELEDSLFNANEAALAGPRTAFSAEIP